MLSAGTLVAGIPWLWEQIIQETLIPSSSTVPNEIIIDENYHRFMVNFEWQLLQFCRINQSTRLICRSERFLRCLLESLFPSVTYYVQQSKTVKESDEQSSTRQREKWSASIRKRLLHNCKGRYEFVWLALFQLSRYTVHPSVPPDSTAEMFLPDPLVFWPLSEPECVPIMGRSAGNESSSSLSSSSSSSSSSSIMCNTSASQLLIIPSRRPLRRQSSSSASNTSGDEGYGSDEPSLPTLLSTGKCCYVSRKGCLLRAEWKQPTLLTCGPEACTIILHPVEVDSGGVEEQQQLSKQKIWYPPQSRRFLFEDMLTLADSYKCLFILESVHDNPEKNQFQQRCSCTVCGKSFPLCGDYWSSEFCGTCLHTMSSFTRFNRMEN